MINFWKRLSAAGNMKFWGVGESCWLLGHGGRWTSGEGQTPVPRSLLLHSVYFTTIYCALNVVPALSGAGKYSREPDRQKPCPENKQAGSNTDLLETAVPRHWAFQTYRAAELK